MWLLVCGIKVDCDVRKLIMRSKRVYFVEIEGGGMVPPLEESAGSGGTEIAAVVSPGYGIEDAWSGSLYGSTGEYSTAELHRCVSGLH